jgi:anti-sigma-K factor RskA
VTGGAPANAPPPVAPIALDHIAGCAECGNELAVLRRVVAVGQETQGLLDLPTPPPAVWDGIQAELAATPDQSSRAVTDESNGSRLGEEAGPVRVADVRARRRGRRRRVATWSVAVGAAAAAAAIAVVVWPREADTPERIVASAELAAFGSTQRSAHGDAEVLAGGQLRLHVADLPANQGYYQVWLIDPDTKQMFPLGVLGESAEAQLPLPPDVNLSRYSVVDVSAELFDNNPAHSGDSLLRGRLG